MRETKGAIEQKEIKKKKRKKWKPINELENVDLL